MNAVTSILIGILVLGWVLYRQLTPRRVRSDGGNRVLLILGVVGVAQLVEFLQRTDVHVGPVAIGSMVVSLAVAAVLSSVRAYTMRVWRADDGWWRRGTPLTLVLWLVSIGSHLGIEALAGHVAGSGDDVHGLGNVTLVLYLAVSLGLQSAIVARRVAAIGAGTPARFGSPTGTVGQRQNRA
jgi:hypothetical protein